MPQNQYPPKHWGGSEKGGPYAPSSPSRNPNSGLNIFALAGAAEGYRKMANSVRGLMDGVGNQTAEIELDASEQTEYEFESRMTPDTVVLVVPRNAAAGANIDGWWTESKNGSCIIHHPAHPASRIVGLVFLGG